MSDARGRLRRHSWRVGEATRVAAGDRVVWLVTVVDDAGHEERDWGGDLERCLERIAVRLGC